MSPASRDTSLWLILKYFTTRFARGTDGKEFLLISHRHTRTHTDTYSFPRATCPGKTCHPLRGFLFHGVTSDAYCYRTARDYTIAGIIMPAGQTGFPATMSAAEKIFSVAVGMPVSRHPPHRSRRAGLPHRAPASGQTQRRWSGYGCTIRTGGIHFVTHPLNRSHVRFRPF